MSPREREGSTVTRWGQILLPLGLLAIVLVALFAMAPALERGGAAPDVTVSHHTIPDGETVVLHVTNNGPEAVTIQQLFVDDAYWNFTVEKTPRLPFLPTGDGPNTLAAGEGARVHVPYHLTLSPDTEMEMSLLLDGGEKIDYEVVGVQTTQGLDSESLGLLAGIGLLVGIVPVGIGMAWYPALRSIGTRWVHATLAFAAGILVFLAIDAGFEALEMTERIPGAFEGQALVVLGALGALVLVQAASRIGTRAGQAPHGLHLAYLIALAIGLHNLAEGLAIGGTYALGQASLATFLILGFMLHNVTEGPAVVAPMARGERPALYHFGLLALLAGGPVVLGGWIGASTLSPTIGALFLAIGVGAIVQVVWELGRVMTAEDAGLGTPLNLVAFFVGLVVMYLTALLVTI